MNATRHPSLTAPIPVLDTGPPVLNAHGPTTTNLPGRNSSSTRRAPVSGILGMMSRQMCPATTRSYVIDCSAVNLASYARPLGRNATVAIFLAASSNATAPSAMVNAPSASGVSSSVTSRADATSNATRTRAGSAASVGL
jgi:hypothetical protein